MIRINLIGQAKGKRKAGRGPSISLPQIPNVGILLFVLLLVVEGAVFYTWQNSASAEANKLNSRLAVRKLELEALTKTKGDIKALKEETDKLVAQKRLFEELFADKVGPANALTFLSFILHPRDETTTSADELKAMEAAGWRVSWDAKRAWITTLREREGEVTIIGEAMGHEDVAELLRRMESSPYFRNPRLAYQEVKKDERIGGVPFVEFKIEASLVYLIVPARKPEPPPEGAEGQPAGDADAVAGAEADAVDGGAGEDADAGPALLIPVVPKAPDVTEDADAEADAAEAVDTADAEDAAAPAPAAPDAAAPIVPVPAKPADKPAEGKAAPPLPSAPPAAEPPPVEGSAQPQGPED